MTLESAPRTAPRSHPVELSAFLPVLALVAIFALAWFSFATRPAGALVATWWPAAGIAVGVAIRLPRRRMWVFAVAAGLVVLGINFAEYQNATVAIADSVGTSLEIITATLILQAGRERVPRLVNRLDLLHLLVAVVVAATVFDLSIALAQFAVGDTTAALVHLASAGPRHAAGMLLIVPLFMRLPDEGNARLTGRTVGHLVVTLAVAALVFLTPQHLPLAFIPIVAPVWGALLVPVRWLIIEMIGIATIASYGSATNRGPFAFDLLGPAGASTLLQFFELAMVCIVLLLALTANRERRATSRIGASELLYRRNFENSLAGMLIAVRTPEGWLVRSHNRAARSLLPIIGASDQSLDELVGQAPAFAIASLSTPGSTGEATVKIADGRHFHVSVAPLHLEGGEESFSVQLLDVTDSLVAKRLIEADLVRAQQVQQALSPSRLPMRRGWEHGAASVTAREVGGDFYDLRISGQHATVALGDVMGKGVGAGILAAVTRTALRAATVSTHPSDALADAARIIEDDLSRANAFVTLNYATIDLLSGRTLLVDAGHGLTFVVRANADVERLATFDFPIGLGTDWREMAVELSPGDGLLMVSDGVLDNWGGSIETLTEAIHGLAIEHRAGSIDDLVEALCAGATTGGERGDDSTAVMLRREGNSR